MVYCTDECCDDEKDSADRHEPMPKGAPHEPRISNSISRERKRGQEGNSSNRVHEDFDYAHAPTPSSSTEGGTRYSTLALTNIPLKLEKTCL